MLPYRYYYEQELKKCFKFFCNAEKVISPQTAFIKSIPIYNCVVRRAAVRSTHHYNNRATWMHGNRKTCNRYLCSTWLAAWIANDNVAQVGANKSTEAWSLGLQRTFMLLDIHVNWQLSKQSMHWPVSVTITVVTPTTLWDTPMCNIDSFALSRTESYLFLSSCVVWFELAWVVFIWNNIYGQFILA